MRFFRTESIVEPVASIVAPKPPVAIIEGWTERELASVYSIAPVRNLKPRETLLQDVEGTDSFFILLDGDIQVVVKCDGQAGRPGVFHKGECIAPLQKSPGLQYVAECVEPCTLIEITPAVMNLLPEKTQLTVYKIAVTSTSRINAYIRTVNGEVRNSNALIAAYIERQNGRNADVLQSAFVRSFLAGIPRMPAYGTGLVMRIMDDRCTVQEVVDGIKTDPSIAGILLRSVNSARYAFNQKIESFYHACMILGLNNIYDLLMQEALQSAMPETENTKQIHRHSCLITAFCNEIATVSKDVHAQAASTIGLLHDVGKGIQVLMKQKHPGKGAHIDALQSAALGAELLRLWGIPARICNVIEHQQQPEFSHPDIVPDEYRREAGVLHIAHILEALLSGEPIASECRIYTRDYMSLLRLPNSTPEDFLTETILPGMARNRQRLPKQVLEILPIPAPSDR